MRNALVEQLFDKEPSPLLGRLMSGWAEINGSECDPRKLKELIESNTGILKVCAGLFTLFSVVVVAVSFIRYGVSIDGVVTQEMKYSFLLEGVVCITLVITTIIWLWKSKQTDEARNRLEQFEIRAAELCQLLGLDIENGGADVRYEQEKVQQLLGSFEVLSLILEKGAGLRADDRLRQLVFTLREMSIQQLIVFACPNAKRQGVSDEEMRVAQKICAAIKPIDPPLAPDFTRPAAALA